MENANESPIKNRLKGTAQTEPLGEYVFLTGERVDVDLIHPIERELVVTILTHYQHYDQLARSDTLYDKPWTGEICARDFACDIKHYLQLAVRTPYDEVLSGPVGRIFTDLYQRLKDQSKNQSQAAGPFIKNPTAMTWRERRLVELVSELVADEALGKNTLKCDMPQSMPESIPLDRIIELYRISARHALIRGDIIQYFRTTVSETIAKSKAKNAETEEQILRK